jgi:nucleotide-binding universal stress UspA family protein
VLLVGSEAWPNKPFITAAIDVLDVAHEEINTTILEAADMLARDLAGVLDIVSAYPRLGPWAIDTIAGLDFDRLRHNFEEEIQTRARVLVSDLSCPIESIRTSHGPPGEAIRRLASQSNSDVIVIGTAARTGVSAWVIGNTSETLLDRVDRDLLILRV